MKPNKYNIRFYISVEYLKNIIRYYFGKSDTKHPWPVAVNFMLFSNFT